MEYCAIDSFGTMVMKEPTEPLSSNLDVVLSVALKPYGKTVSMGAELSTSTDIILTHHEPTGERKDQVELHSLGEAQQVAFNSPVGTLGCYVPDSRRRRAMEDICPD